MKRQIIFSILVLFALQGMSQTNSEKAREVYKTAFEAYGKGNYQVSIDNLENAIILLGSTKVLIQDLMVKSYFGLKDYRQAKVEADKYFALNPPQDEGYNEMLLLSGEIDKQIEILAREQLLKEADQAAWNAAIAKNTREAYEQYLASFPEGQYKSGAKTELEKIAWANASKINTIEVYKKFISDFPYGAHSKDANAKISEYDKEMQMKQNPGYYFENAFMSYNWDLVMRLVKYGANVNMNKTITNSSGESYIYTALSHGGGGSIDDTLKRLEYVKFLLEHNADPNTVMKRYRYSDPDYAVEEYLDPFSSFTTIEILKLFIKSGLDVNYSHGALLNHLVSTHKTMDYEKRRVNNFNIIEFLLQNKADPYITWRYHGNGYSMQMKSAYGYAKKWEKTDLIELFKKYKK